MAESDNPLDVRIIDFLGNQNLVQLTEGMGAFRNEIEQLKESINALSTSTEEATKAQKELSENLSNFYKQGHSDQASRGGGGGAEDQTGGGAGMGPSEGSSTPPESGNQNASFMQRLRQSLRNPTETIDKYQKENPIDLPGVGPRQGDTSGPNGPTDGASSGASFPQLPEKPEPAQIPQFGEFQVDTLLRMMGGFAQRRAENRAAKTPGGGQNYARAAYGLYKAAEFAPVGAIAQQYASNLGYPIDRGSIMGAGQMANATGSQGQFGPFSIPYMNETYLKGVEESFQRMKRAVSKGGLSGKQVEFIDQQLAGLGYTGGRGGGTVSDDLVDQYRELDDSIMQRNKRLGENPEMYMLQDRALRYGNGTMREFFHLMTKEYPKAADVAHVSQEQMIKDAEQLAETYEKMGGTAAKAISDNAYFTQSGLPPSVINQYMQNPFFQSAAFRQTGLMPNAQASMPRGAVMSSMLQSLNELGMATGGFPTQVQSASGALGELGLKNVSGGFDQQIGLMAEQTGLSPDVLQQLMDPKTGQVKAGYNQIVNAMTASEGFARQFSQQSIEAQFNGNAPYEALLNRKTNNQDSNTFSLGEMMNQIRQTRVPGREGQAGFVVGEKYKDELDRIANLNREEIDQIMKNGVNGQEKERLEGYMAEINSEMQAFISEKGLPDEMLPDAANPNKTYIEFTGEAKRYFQQVDGPYKDAANRGEGSANAGAARPGASQGGKMPPPAARRFGY